MLITNYNYFNLFTNGVDIKHVSNMPYIIELLTIMLFVNEWIIVKMLNINNAIILNFILSFSFIGRFGCSIGAYIKIKNNTDRNINIVINWFNMTYFTKSAMIVNDNSDM